MNAGSADRAQWGEESGVAPAAPGCGTTRVPWAGESGGRAAPLSSLLDPSLFLLRARVAPLVV